MLRRGISVLGVMALILSLDARSLYRRKRWTHYPSQSNDIRDALRELEMKKSNFDDQYGYYNTRDNDFDNDIFNAPSSPQVKYPKYPSFASYATPADLAELRDILEPESDTETESETINADDMAKMLDTTEDLTSENDAEPVTPEPEPVSKAELEDIFSTPVNEDDADNENDKKKKSLIRKRTDPVSEDKDTREWLMEHFFDNDNDNQRAEKKKRQTSVQSPSESAEVLAVENRLLEKENEYLAGALNAATMGQMDRTTKHMKEQYDYLKKAVAIEEALQSVYGNADDDDDTEKRSGYQEDEAEEDEQDKKKKKRIPVKKDEEDDFNGINPLLRKLVQEYESEQDDMMKRKRQDQDQEMDSDEALNVQDIGGTSEELPEDAAQEEDEDLSDNLQTMVSNLSPRQRHLMQEEVNTLLESGLLESKCPAVSSVADNCERLMKQFNVDLDAQARDVCNRHKVCYSCGSSIDPQKTLNRKACDRIFMEQSKALCDRDQECQKSAMGLFVLMKKEHMYIDWPSPVTAELCSEKCVVDFLLDGSK